MRREDSGPGGSRSVPARAVLGELLRQPALGAGLGGDPIGEVDSGLRELAEQRVTGFEAALACLDRGEPGGVRLDCVRRCPQVVLAVTTALGLRCRWFDW